MSQLPVGLGPLMGFALWHLSRGDAQADVLEQMRAAPQFGGISEPEIEQALAAAVSNNRYTQVAQTLGNANQLGEAYGLPLAADTVFGVRVLITHTDPQGVESVASVVVNAAAGAAIGDITQAALDYANSGSLSNRTGNASPGTYGVAAIGQVVLGGLPGAVVGIL